MEVILTFSNRITLAGAIPLLVAAALAVLVAAVALAPSRPAEAAADANACKISPVILDMLLARYDQKPADCDDLNLESPPDLKTGMKADTWDFTGKSLSSFAITDDDAKYLKVLIGGSDGTSVVESAVRYIDLTDNPLTAADVSFKNIPSNVAVKLTAASNVKGFQQADYTVTEDAPGYISAAFPDLLSGSNTHINVTVDLTGDVDDDLNQALQSADSDKKIRLVSFGTGDNDADKSKTFEIDSESGSVIFYWPITVKKDNENEDDWDITLAINEDTGFRQSTSASEAAGATPTVVSLAIEEAEVTILDVDEPATIVCDRSEDVEAAILAIVQDSERTVGTYGGTSTSPRDCDELTKRDLSKITQLTVKDEDTNDREPLETLLAADFSDLTGVFRLHVVGARTLPSGIFAGVGKDAKQGETKTTAEISFAKNQPADSDDDSVGNFTPSTIPQHIWDDQETYQVITLTDDKDSSDKGVTKGLDADLYAGTEKGHFFVLTNAATAKYVLGKTVTFAGEDVSTYKLPKMGTGTTVESGDPIGNTTAIVGAEGDKTSRVVRFAVEIPNVDDEDKGDRSEWLFLFATGAANSATENNPANAGDLKDIASVSIADDD